MTTVEKVTQARNSREATIALAESLDRLLSMVEEGRLVPASDPWDEWEATPAIQVPEATPPDYDSAALEHARQRLEQAKQAGDEAEIKAATAALWLAENPGSPPPEPDQGRRERVTIDHESGVTVEVPVVDSARKKARYEWAKARNIGDLIGLDNEDAARAYSKGGGLWLYHGAHKVVTENFPRDWRVDLINDVELDSVAAAQEIARDLLKADAETTKSAPAHASGDIG